MGMRRWRIPRALWAWAGTVLVVAVLALPPLLTLWVEPATRTIGGAAAILSIAAHLVMLVSAIIFYFAWRITLDHGLAWLAAAFTALGVEDISLAGLRAASGGDLSDHATQLLFIDVLCVTTVVAILVLYRDRPPPHDPVVMGFGVGILVSALRIGLVEGGDAAAPIWALALALAVLVILYVALLRSVARLVPNPPWAQGRITAAVVLLGCAQVIAHPPLGELVPGALALVSEAGGAVLLCTTAMGLLRLSIQESTTTLAALSERTEQLEASNRVDRERLHEINAAIAGISTASRLIHDEALPSNRRIQLERMVESEISRLAGMIGPRSQVIREVDLDEALEPVITAQRILGRSVEWTPTGCRVVGRSEEITEIVTTLLENAAQHAPGSPVWIATRDLRGSIELTVSDVGPGIPPEVGDSVFAWGRRGPDSRGEGIGLCVAKRLAEGMGGALTCVPTNGCGAIFVVQLEGARKAHDATNVGA